METKIIIKEMLFIITVVCVPLIILGFFILKNGKYKKQEIIIGILLLLMIYTSNARNLYTSAYKVILAFSASDVTETKTDITFLKNYKEKIDRKGYLDKYDVKEIIGIADSKSKEIKINYKDESSNININITNKDDEQIQKLYDELKYDYYLFDYETNNGDIIINISRYIIEKQNKEEKNIDIIIKGEKNEEIIENTEKSINDTKTVFKFKNNVKVPSTTNELSSFKILLANIDDNYVPVTDDINQYETIESYEVSNTGVRIILKNGISLKNKDYTLRINRYDEEFNVLNSYYYEYEPIVTEYNNNDQITLDIKFENTYTINELKNIEIIYGK